MHIKVNYKNQKGFTLLEIILLIVIASIMAVALLGSLIRPFSEQAINFNDINLIVKNIDEVYYSMLKKVGPSGDPGVAYTIDGANVDCSDPLSFYILCRANNLGNNVKYTIQSSVANTVITATPLQSMNDWTVNTAITFYTRQSEADPWKLFTTVNRTLRVPQ